MCGINGIVRLNRDAPPIDLAEVCRTRDAMASRGPDGTGLWSSKEGTVAFGHRRLAIIDLTDAASQPMVSADGRWVIVFNGEIYNYRELRAALERRGATFRTTSDTEVLLNLMARDGRAALPRVRGMFTFALWDNVERRLLLARDPYGIKPLYFATQGAVLRFASQVKALEAGGGIGAEADPAGLVGFLLWGSVPEPFTIRRGVRSLSAGHTLEVVNGQVSEPEPFLRVGLDEPQVDERALAPLEAVEDSVRAHLVSDVPVAVFLSAGLDSALVATLAARAHVGPLRTFTVTFDEFVGTGNDEGPLAREVARRLGAEHIERRVRHEDFLHIWEDAVAAMDQPSIDGFNTFLVSRVAHEAGLKVVLSGLGGDELFGSYPSFRDVPRWARAARLLRPLRGVWPRLARTIAPSRPKLAGLAGLGGTLAGGYFLRRGLFLPAEVRQLLPGTVAEAGLAAYDPLVALDALMGQTAGDSWVAVHLLESGQYMRNQLLRDADWASMAHSLELRVPLVDPVLRRTLARSRFEPARSRGKAAFVRAASADLPAELFDRPKSGFSVPIGRWLGLASPGDGQGLISRRLAARVLKEFDTVLAPGAWAGTRAKL